MSIAFAATNRLSVFVLYLRHIESFPRKTLFSFTPNRWIINDMWYCKYLWTKLFPHLENFCARAKRFAESVRTLRVLFILLDYAYLCICLYNPFRNLFNYKYEHFTTQQTLIVIVDFVCTVLTYNSCIIQTKVLHYNISMDLY